MRRTVALSLAASWLIAAPSLACAGVDVSPDSSDQGIQIRAERNEPGHAPSVSAGESDWLVFRGVAVSLAGRVWIHGIKLLPEGADEAAAVRARIREALTRVPLPGFAAHVQPATRTLVNAETIFYTEPAPTDRIVNTLGYHIRIQATPMSFAWQFGDGTTETTTSPGAPYPDETVTYRYQHPGTVAVSVTVGYHVRYSTDGGPWEELGEPIYASGPPSTLSIDEAQAVLITP